MGYQPTKKPETLEPPGLFEALLEEIEAGRISAKEAAERYTNSTLARTINPTEADARILRKRAHLNAMHHIPEYRPTMQEAAEALYQLFRSDTQEPIEPYQPQPEYEECVIPYPSER